MGTVFRWAVLVLGVIGLLTTPATVHAQLDQYDYEYLSFRGIGADVGQIWPNKVEPTTSWGGRVDMGYAGPGLRIVPGLRFWSSNFKATEVAELEEALKRVLESTNPGDTVPDIDLGMIQWSDVVLSLDAHFVWEVPFGALSFLGAGASAHFLNGSGEAVNGTFVEDLLDRVSAGVNAHAGLEVPLGSAVRLYGQGRFEILDDLNYAEVRGGLQFMFGASDERAGR